MKDCIFCKIVDGEIPSKRIYEDDKVIAIMDANPVVDGHVLIIPKKHVTDFSELDEQLLAHIHKIAKNLCSRLMGKLNSNALTLCVNYGDSQVVKHFHLHLLPDYNKKSKECEVDEIYSILKED